MFISDTKKESGEVIFAQDREAGSDEQMSGMTSYDDRTQKNEPLKSGMRYLTASIVIAVAAAVYGLFSHGVYSYYMTYAFMIPLLGGALPQFIKAVKQVPSGRADVPGHWISAGDLRLAVIATLTAGSLLKGALDIYGTSNRLLMAYPAAAAILLIAGGILFLRKSHSGSTSETV